MKNIAVFQNFCIDIDQRKQLTDFCIDPITGDIYAYGEGFLYKIKIPNTVLEEFINLQNEFEVTSSFTVVGMTCNSVSQEICLCFKAGDVITLNCVSKELQCVGAVESGLQLMEWSPDQEVVAFVTGNETIIIMTGSFDPVAEVDFHQSSFGEKQFITVGWGKKETQFHGSEGKTAALQSANDIVLSPNKDDSRPRLSWRGDGSMFAVSMLNKDVHFRDIKVFGRDGVLLYTAQPTSGLEVALAWRPSGSLFATTHTLPNKQNVIFFEKNGLHHGQFTLSNQPGLLSVPLLAWNMDSSILAVWCINNNTRVSFLQLWTCKNYHWYLKQKFIFGEETKLKLLQWDVEFSMRLHIVYGDLKYCRFDFVWTVNHDQMSSSEGSVAVIDGAKLLVTSFCQAIVPPPMCQHTLQASDSINAVIFGPTSVENNMLIILSNGNVEMFKQDWMKNYNLCSLGPVDIYENGAVLKKAWHEFSHWLWASERYVLCCYPMPRSTMLVVLFINELDRFETRQTVNVDGVIVSLISSTNPNQAIIQLSNGSLMFFDIEGTTLLPCPVALPEPCIQIFTYNSTHGQKFLGLSSRGKLYLDNTEIASGVTSIFLLPKFLLITTTKHTLLCLSLANEVCKFNPECGRRIEIGARIVVAFNTTVVLQMPRGNLEAITPRPLVIHVAAKLLERGKYKKTFELFRQQRVNLNLLFDHNPQTFLSDVEHFVNDINFPSWLSCFLMELVSEDVTQTMYSKFYDQRSRNEVFPDKVSVVCDKVREALKARSDSHAYLLPIITSLVRKGSDEDLAAALNEARSNNETISVDEALKHMLYMVDVNELYNIALGLYDFDLVMLVASKSTKDPKEYIPFLNNLRRMETNYQKYTIDKYLKRNKSALKHITQCPDNVDECIQFIKENGLFSEGLHLLPKATEEYQEVANAYGDYLMRNQCYYEASIMYQRGKKYSKALDASCIALDWQGALILMYELQYSDNQISEVCHRLVSSLINNKQFLEASNILIDHLKDVEEAVNVLSQGHYWIHALRVACKYNLFDLIETRIKTGILDHYSHLLNKLQNTKEQFETHKLRLAIVKQEREQKLKTQEAAEYDMGESDLYSDTSSVSETSRSSKSNSGYSVRSSQSSKNRRKHERKLLSLKEGSPHEDIALIQALHNEITACLAMRDEVKEVCKVLLRFDKDVEASTIQKLLTNVLTLMERSTNDIWPVDRQTLGSNVVSNHQLQTFGPDATANSILSSFGHNSEMNSRLLLLEPQLRYAPKFVGQPKWQLKTLENF